MPVALVCSPDFLSYSATKFDTVDHLFQPHFKGEINDALPRKRHQERHLEFCIACLLMQRVGSSNLPGRATYLS